MIAELPGGFRAACHWALYTSAIAGPDGLPSTETPPGTRSTPELQKARVALAMLRVALYPED